MRVSVVVTVRNEEKTIKALLDSLLSQTKLPDEIVIVDGNSTDKTVNIVKSYSHNHKFIKLIRDSGSISHGRNTAIKNSQNDIVAQIDAGCIAKKDWLRKITVPFTNSKVRLVAGFYEMTGETPLQKALAPFLGVPKERFDPRSFLPSARSVAFRKDVWEEVGGYSEKLDRAGEDTFFNYRVILQGITIVREKDAIVYWELPKTLNEALKKFYTYAKGDAQAGIWWHPAQKLATHNIKISLIFARYIFGGILLFSAFFARPLFFVVLILSIFYIFWCSWRMEDVISDMKAKMWIPIIHITSDLAVMAGFISGMLRR